MYDQEPVWASMGVLWGLQGGLALRCAVVGFLILEGEIRGRFACGGDSVMEATDARKPEKKR